jgi:hypothetical protein
MRNLLVLLAGLSLSTSPLLAADARALFGSGASALQAGRADEAVKDFEAAYAEQPSPSLLYWLGEAHRAAGHSAKATSYYQLYLKNAPKGDKVASAQAALATLSKARPQKKTRHLKAPEVRLAQAAPDLPLPAANAPTTTVPPPELPLPRQAAAAPPAASPSISASAPPAASPATSPAPPATARAINAAPAAGERAPAGPTDDAAAADRWKAAASAPPAHPPVLPPQPVDLIREGAADFWFLGYVARLVAVSGQYMGTYATFVGPGDRSTLYTHGFVAGRQTEHFRHGLYAGFGTEFGGGPDTLKRYELSYQLLYTPFGFDPIAHSSHPSTSLISPHVGVRVGAAGVDSQVLTGGSMKVGLALAVQAGFDLQVFRWLVLSPGVGYDTNVGIDLNRNDAGVSGFSFDLAATLRY